jgi:hypothetical protein
MTKNNAAIDQLKKSLSEVSNEIQGTAANDSTPAGTDMEDGSVFAGVTRDGQKIFAMPMDLGFTATFNDAVKAVEKLNEKKALGHDDWQIPDLETLKILHSNKNQGSLKDTFKTTNKWTGSVFPAWYWSSSSYDGSSHAVDYVRFWGGFEYWDYKDDFHLSCRPVRLSPVSAPSLG